MDGEYGGEGSRKMHAEIVSHDPMDAFDLL